MTSAFGVDDPITKSVGSSAVKAAGSVGDALRTPRGAAGLTGAGALAVGGVLHRKNKKIKQLEAQVAKSGFGVEDSRISKGAAMGTREAKLAEAHAAGDHAKDASRHCPKCSGGWVSGAKQAGKIARKAV